MPYLMKKGFLYDMEDSFDILMDYSVISLEKNMNPECPTMQNSLFSKGSRNGIRISFSPSRCSSGMFKMSSTLI